MKLKITVKVSILSGLLCVLISPGVSAQHTDPGKFKEIRLGDAICRTTDSTLVINSGKIERTYRITPGGLSTRELRLPEGSGGEAFQVRRPGKQEWTVRSAQGGVNPSQQERGDRGEQEGVYMSEQERNAGKPADWDPGTDNTAQLEYMRATIEDDSGFTSKHITVVNEFTYAATGTKLRYIIWVYPGSGIRTQIELKMLENVTRTNRDGQTILNSAAPDLKNRAVDYLPVSSGDAAVTAFGYYNATQNRDTDTTPILREERATPGSFIGWASGLLIRYRTNGLLVVKESHKCVNQPGIATGGFAIGPHGITVTGPGLAGEDLDTGGYKKCWADWIIPYKGDSTDALLALKEFDRLRYPVRASDRYIMANTWGNSDNSPEGSGQYAAREENVLKEITSQAGLGIDVQQIDDGWQGRDYKQWKPAAAVYPEGWNRVKEYAARENVKLGLWAAWTIPEDDLKWNYDHGGFKYIKLDFSSLNTKKTLDNFMAKVRSFVLYTHNSVRVNWDVTENAPRVGYFYAREYGNVWLENRKPVVPANVIYKPYLVLRDAWQVAKYINLNQFQLAIQNVDRVDRQASDAYLYKNPYSVAIALMGSPMFFCLTQYYPEEDRTKIKHILTAYKRVRDELFKGYVFPIGDKPDNRSWTGFQDVLPGTATGYLLLFRELRNDKDTQAVRLNFIRGRRLELTNLLTGKKETVLVDKSGYAKFTMANPADFRFYRYTIR